MHQLTYGAIEAATRRIAGRVRPVTLSPLEPGVIRTAHRDPLDDRVPEPCQVWLALEYLQHTGSFAARGAQNFFQAHRAAGTLSDAGVTIAAGGAVGRAYAWSAQQQGVPATLFLPETTGHPELAGLRAYGADVRLAGAGWDHASAMCENFAKATGALAAHTDDPLVAAGEGTLVEEIRSQIPGLDSVVVAVGGDSLFTGVATAARRYGMRVIAAEAEGACPLNTAVTAMVAGGSATAGAPDGHRVSPLALRVALQDSVHSVIVTDAETATARRMLRGHREVGESAVIALAALTAPPVHVPDRDLPTRPVVSSRGYRPGNGEKVAVVLSETGQLPG